MAVNCPSYQHAKPFPIDNIEAPKPLTQKHRPPVNQTRAEKSGVQLQTVDRPTEAKHFYNNIAVALSNVSAV